MAEYVDYADYTKATQDAIKARAAEHKNQAAQYLADYNREHSNNPVQNETSQYLVSNGNYGRAPTVSYASRDEAIAQQRRNAQAVPKYKNILAESAIANGAGSSNTSGGYSPRSDVTFSKIGSYYDQYKAGDLSYQDFMNYANMSPEMWEQQMEREQRRQARAEERAQSDMVEDRIRHEDTSMPDEEQHRLQATLEDNYVYPQRPDFSIDAANAALLAQQRGQRQTDYYRNQLASMQNPTSGTQQASTASQPTAEEVWSQDPTNMILDTSVPATREERQQASNNPDFERRLNDANRMNIPLDVFAQQIYQREGDSEFFRYLQQQIARQNPYSPMATYQQNNFSGNPQSNPEAQSLLDEYNNRVTRHYSR